MTMLPLDISPSNRHREWSRGMAMLPALVLFSGCAAVSNECSNEGQAAVASRPGMVRSNAVGWYGPGKQCRDDGECRRANDLGPDAIPGPPGTYVRPWNDAMICSARQQQFLVARHEWYNGGLQPGPEGQRHLNTMAEAMLLAPHQVVVEEEPTMLFQDEAYQDAIARTNALNQQRRAVVVDALLKAGVADADQRVWLSSFDRVGIHGAEAPQAYNQLIFGGNQQGNQGGGMGGGLGGAMGGGGFGGGGGGFGGGGIF
jgi:hypothetical protein